MKWMISVGVMNIFLSPLAFANAPVTLSGPNPAIASSYAAGISNVITYTITNKVPKSLPVNVSGVSGAITRTPVPNDCGNMMPPGPSTCNIGITIRATTDNIGSLINQTLLVDYAGRLPLSSTISFTTRPAYLYVTNFNTSTVSKCDVNIDTGIINNCTASNPGGTFNSPSGISFNSAGTIAYVTNSAAATVSTCPLNPDHTLGICTASNPDSSFNAPSSIALNQIDTLAYATNFLNNNVSLCSIDASAGTLTSCTDSGVGAAFNRPDVLVLNTTDTFAYVTDTPANAVSICPVSSNGTLGSCTTKTDPTIFRPTGMSLNSMNTFAYINNTGVVDTVSVCPVSLTNGTIGTCTSSNPGGAFLNIGFGKNAITNNFLFVCNAGSNRVVSCSINANGALGTCTGYSDATFADPQGIALN